MRRLILLPLLLLLAAGCSPEEAELTTTTTLATEDEVNTTTTATSAPDSTVDTTEDDESAPDDSETGVPEYEIVVRSSGTAGETLWVLVEPADYSDVDLENVIRVIVDVSDFDLDGIRVFDDAEALEAGRLDDTARTEEEQALVDAHFLVSLEDGAVIAFQGPYAEFGEIAVGS